MNISRSVYDKVNKEFLRSTFIHTRKGIGNEYVELSMSSMSSMSALAVALLRKATNTKNNQTHEISQMFSSSIVHTIALYIIKLKTNAYFRI